MTLHRWCARESEKDSEKGTGTFYFSVFRSHGAQANRMKIIWELTTIHNTNALHKAADRAPRPLSNADTLASIAAPITMMHKIGGPNSCANITNGCSRSNSLNSTYLEYRFAATRNTAITTTANVPTALPTTSAVFILIYFLVRRGLATATGSAPPLQVEFCRYPPT
jgi:hypothetical protein